jgi:hypothetical protein
LYEKAKEMAPNKRWVAVLHPDEFPSGNPLEMLSQVDNLYPSVNSIELYNLHYFPHVSQRTEWEETTKNKGYIEPMLKWAMSPGCPEFRYFKNKPEFQYGNYHSRTIPIEAYNPHIRIEGFVHKHITYRTKEQALKRAKIRIESGWQPVDYVLVLEKDDIFFETLKYPEDVTKKYPHESSLSYYNWPHTSVKKIKD